MKQLIGLKVDSSFSRNAMQICLGPKGCLNLMTLLLIAVPGILYYYYPPLIRTGKITNEEFYGILKKDERNACLHIP